jgi:hypothetical protein
VGKGERAEGAAMSSAAEQQAGATRSPEEIRADIDTTREQVGDTVEALAEKTDVKAQVQQRVETVKGNVRAKADEARTKAQASTPATAQQGGRQAVAKVRENPAPVVLGGAVLVAFLLGRRSARS